jgi:RNA polymerase sigma-70 factor (ECF subfamily)
MTERDVDQALVERAQTGDKRAFELLVAKYQRKLARLIGRLIHDPHEVEDVTQEAFIKAYRALGNFRGDSAFYTWLYRIGINTAKNFLVSQGRRPMLKLVREDEDGEPYDELEQIQDHDTPESRFATQQIAEAVNAGIEALPPELGTALRLREIDGLSYEEIAELMNCPVGTVRSRIFRAREAIAKCLRPHLEIHGDRRW